MNSLDALREFLGWCTVINFGILVFASIFVTLFRGTAVSIHSKMLALAEEDLNRQYFQYLAQYKIAIVVLNLVPYLALRIMA